MTLDGRQVFYIFMAGAMLVSMVFLLGIIIGKRMEVQSMDMYAGIAAHVAPLQVIDELSDLVPHSATAKTRTRAGDTLPVKKSDPVPEKASKVNTQATRAALTQNSDAILAKKTSQQTEKTSSSSPVAKTAAQVPPKAAEKSTKNTGKSRFALQIGSFRERAEADAFYERMKKAGYNPKVVEAEVPEKGRWYRVRIGGFTNYEQSLAAKKSFENKQHIIAYVTRLQP